MDALSERKIEIVRHLVESAPDRVVGGLQQALSQTAIESPLGRVKLVVETEVADRTLRNLTLQPIAPMCVAGGDPGDVTFPPRVLALIGPTPRTRWRLRRSRACATDPTPTS